MAYARVYTTTIAESLCGAADSTDFPFLFIGTFDGTGGEPDLRTAANGGSVQHTVSVGGVAVPADLVFASDSAGSSLLDWEVESYNGVTGFIAAWVRIPTLSSSVDTVLYLLYGDSGVTTWQGDVTGTWNTNIKRVYHLPDGSTLSANDSTGVGNGSNSGVTAVAGQIDGAGRWTNPSSITSAVSTGLSLGALSISIWIKTTDTGSEFCVSYGVGGTAVYLGFGSPAAGRPYLGDATTLVAGATTLHDGNWHHLVGTYNGSNSRKIYIDGALSNSDANSLTIGSSPALILGRSLGSTPFQLIGSMDEVHIHSVELSASWILSEFNNQSNPSAFFSLTVFVQSVDLDLIAPESEPLGITVGFPEVVLDLISPESEPLTLSVVPVIELELIDPESEPLSISAVTAQDLTLGLIAPESEPQALALNLELVLDLIAPKSQPGVIITYGEEDLAKPGVLLIAGAVRHWKHSTFRISRTLNGRDTGSFSQRLIEGDTEAAPGDEVQLIWLGDLKFGGLIEAVTDSAIDAHDEEDDLAVVLSGYDAYWDRITIHKFYSLPLGAVTKIILFDIWEEHLAQFGVTYDYEGPTAYCGEMTFHFIAGSEVKRQLETRSPGYKIFIDEHKRLRYIYTVTPSEPAPYSIFDGSANWDKLSVTRSRSQKRNRMWTVPSKDVQAISTELYTGDGDNKVFRTRYNLDIKPIVKIDGVTKIVTEVGNYILDYDFTYVPNGVGVFAKVAPAPGAIVSVQAPIPFIQAAKSEDEADIALNGLYESSYHGKDLQTLDSAQAFGDGAIEMYKADTEVGTLSTNDEKTNDQWLKPGMGISIEKDKPRMSGTYSVESVQSSEQDLTLWRHTAELRKGAGFDLGSSNLNELQVASRITQVAVKRHISFYLGTETYISTGLVAVFESIPYIPGGCTLESWDMRFLDAPEGDYVSVDLLINGGSIYPSGDANKAVVPDGSTAQHNGFNFTALNARYTGGEIVQANILRVGASRAGRRGTLHLVFRS